jgi:hypothetical protein
MRTFQSENMEGDPDVDERLILILSLNEFGG